MVHFCAVPGCSNRSDRETHLSFHRLPLKNKKVLKQWIHKIGRADLPINGSTRVCSEHFVNSKGRRLRQCEVPSQKLPVLPTTVSSPPPRKPIMRIAPPERSKTQLTSTEYKDVGVNTDLTGADLQFLEGELSELKDSVQQLNNECIDLKDKQHFRLKSIGDDNNKVRFYTGFATLSALMVCFNFLGESVNKLHYWASTSSAVEAQTKSSKGRKRLLSPLEEFFLVLICLRLGLLEQDLAYRFGISQSTVSCIFSTWINLLYLQFKQIPIWPPKALVLSNMPRAFKVKYPSTRVIIDATEIYIEKPAVPELQQLTFSSYKNHNTYKGLIGISPSGAIIFISDLYPGCISDKELTRRSGLLDLLDGGDSVMADRGFDIEDDMALLGVKLNIPPFLRGKEQLSRQELVETRRIASLRIHVERAMEQLKNFHIFDKPLVSSFRDTANQVFFVCAVLTNFYPPLCV